MERRARGAALRVGQRRRTSPQRAVSCSCNPCRTCGKACVRVLVRRWVIRVGSSVARLGVQASRDRARVRGLLGQRPSTSSVRQAETMRPLVRARPMATGGPWHRVRRVVPHAAMASGGCASWKHARGAEPAVWRHTSGVAAAQSRPTKAAQASWDPCGMRPLPAGASVAKRDRRADVLRRHEREPGARQTLRMR